jgi:four helix bundle protein
VLRNAAQRRFSRPAPVPVPVPVPDQLDRAATSVVLNIAEGAGEFSRDEKQRFYRMARRSATETAAILDILDRRQAVAASVLAPALELLERVVAMLARLAGA